MIKKITFALLATTFISTAASAVDAAPPAGAAPATSANASAQHSAPDAKNWDSLSKAEKVKLIEQKHQASIQKANARWKSKTDDEKIAAYEKRRNAARERFQAKNNPAATSGATPNAAAAVSAPPAPAKQ